MELSNTGLPRQFALCLTLALALSSNVASSEDAENEVPTIELLLFLAETDGLNELIKTDQDMEDLMALPTLESDHQSMADQSNARESSQSDTPKAGGKNVSNKK